MELVNLEFYITISALVGFIFLSIALYSKVVNLKEKEANLVEEIANGFAERHELKTRLSELEEAIISAREDRTQAITAMEYTKNELSKLEELIQNEKELREKADEARNAARIDAETASQRVLAMQREMSNWEATKAQHLEAAKASIADAGAQLSNKLLEDHKREAAQMKETTDKVMSEKTEELRKKFENVFSSMSMLHDRIEKSQNTVDIVERALLNPSGAGALSEITLSNIFKSSNLHEGRDYRLQYWIKDDEGNGFKPDAVVFLPQNNVLAIDSKASKFFVEIAKSIDDPAKTRFLEAGLKRSMNDHLKDLISKNYGKAVEQQLQRSGKEERNVTVFMFLPSEAALDKLRELDSKFIERAHKEKIIPVGPSGLVNILLQAELLISHSQQEENAKHIIQEVTKLMNSVVNLQAMAKGIGRNILQAYKKYDTFAGSFNANIIGRARKLNKLGVNLPANKELEKLERHQIVSNGELIDANVGDENDDIARLLDNNDKKVKEIAEMVESEA
ncbi:DNA recombination protein RmuC [Rickettsiales bacterium]|nr:DNA recombination protein RmuC [Rickettsiales bacterium]